MLSDHRILCRPLLILLSIFPSIRGFSSDLALCIRWPQYWSFSFSIDPSNEYSELISFRIDWFGLLGVQETLKNLLQHHNSKCINSLALSVLYGSPTLTSVHDYWKKKISLTMWAFVSKMMSLFFNTLSRFVIAFLPRKASTGNQSQICIPLGWVDKMQSDYSRCTPTSPVIQVDWEDRGLFLQIVSKSSICVISSDWAVYPEPTTVIRWTWAKAYAPFPSWGWSPAHGLIMLHTAEFVLTAELTGQWSSDFSIGMSPLRREF